MNVLQSLLLAGTGGYIIFIIIGLALIGVGIFLFFKRKKYLNTVMDMKFLHTSPAKNIIDNYESITADLGKGSYSEYVEVKGSVKSSNPLKSQHTQTECVWYKSEVIREYEEEVTTTDSEGNTRRETRRGSEVISSVTNFIPFDLQDSTGSVKINPEAGEIIPKQVYNQFQNGEYRGALNIVINALTGSRRTIGYRYTESLIPLNYNLYIIGEATDRDGELSIKKPSDKKKKFIVSCKSEEELVKNYQRTALFMLIAAIALPLIGIGINAWSIISLLSNK